MQRQKIFLTEDLDIQHTNDKIHIYHNKENAILKTFPGGPNFSLFKIKGSHLLAYVKLSEVETTLINQTTFAEIDVIKQMRLSPASRQLNDDVLVCVCETIQTNISIYYLKTRTHSEFIQEAHLKKCEVLSDNTFAVLGPSGFAKIYEASLEKLEYQRIIPGYLTNLVALSSQAYLVCFREPVNGPLYFQVRDKEHQICKEKNYTTDIMPFRELVVLPDQTTVLGLTKNGDVYGIFMHDLSFRKIEFNLPHPIDNLVLTEAGNLLAIFEDGNHVDVGAEFSNQKELAVRIYQETGYYKDLANLISEYGRSVSFFKLPDKKPESENLISQQLLSVK